MSRIFGETRQIAFVLSDLEKGLEYWTGSLGVGPFYTMRDLVFENYRYRGEALPAPRISLAFGFSGSVQVELIQQHDDRASAYRDFLGSGREGFHHVSSWLTAADYDATMARMLAAGTQVAHEGSIPGSGIRFAYFATERDPGGLYYEMADLLSSAVYPLVQRIEEEGRTWDGRDPVRDFADLDRQSHGEVADGEPAD